jgi:hypothetical protein
MLMSAKIDEQVLNQVAVPGIRCQVCIDSLVGFDLRCSCGFAGSVREVEQVPSRRCRQRRLQAQIG